MENKLIKEISLNVVLSVSRDTHVYKDHVASYVLYCVHIGKKSWIRITKEQYKYLRDNEGLQAYYWRNISVV